MSIENYEYDAQDTGVLKGQLDAEEVVNKLAMNLRCYYYDPAEGVYVAPDNVEPYLNEEGISKISAVLRARISNNNQYSKLKTEEIKSIRLATIRNLWRVLCINHDRYGLDITHLSTVIQMVDDALHLFLSRTESGGFLSFIKGLFKGSESYSENNTDSEPKKGIFG